MRCGRSWRRSACPSSPRRRCWRAPMATSSPLTSSSSWWRRAAVLATSSPSATVSTAMASAVPNRWAQVEGSSEGNESDGQARRDLAQELHPAGVEQVDGAPDEDQRDQRAGELRDEPLAQPDDDDRRHADDDAGDRGLGQLLDDLDDVGEPPARVDADVEDLLDLRGEDLDAQAGEEARPAPTSR